VGAEHPGGRPRALPTRESSGHRHPPRACREGTLRRPVEPLPSTPAANPPSNGHESTVVPRISSTPGVSAAARRQVGSSFSRRQVHRRRDDRTRQEARSTPRVQMRIRGRTPPAALRWLKQPRPLERRHGRRLDEVPAHPLERVHVGRCSTARTRNPACARSSIAVVHPARLAPTITAVVVRRLLRSAARRLLQVQTGRPKTHGWL